MPGTGTWEEAKHPRAQDGKFGEGAGTPAAPAAAPGKKKPGTPKQKHASARAKAKGRADEIVAKAKEKAKSIKGGAKAKAAAATAKAASSGKKLTGAQKTKHAAAKKRAKAKADEIVAKAKERAAAIKAKAGVAPRKSAAPKPKTDLQEFAAQSKHWANQAKTMVAVTRGTRSERTAHDAMVIAVRSAENAERSAKTGGANPAADKHSQTAARHAQQAKQAYAKRFGAHADPQSAPVASLTPKPKPLPKPPLAAKPATAPPVTKPEPLKLSKPAEPLSVAKPAVKPAPQSPATTGAGAASAQPLGDNGLAELRKKFTSIASPEEFEAVGYYQGMFSQTINKALRKGGEPEKDKKLVEWATKNLDSVLEKNKSTKPMITYRGSGPHESFANLKEGQTFVDNGFMSTSADQGMTMGGEFQFHITSPAGTKMGAITNDANGREGAWGLEKEVLLGRGTALRLDRREQAVHEEGYPITVMHMTVVGQK